MFDRRVSCFNYNNFEDAKSESAIIFCVYLIWGLKEGPKKTDKIWSFWLIRYSYINFNIFEDAKSEPAIIFHICPIWGPKWVLGEGGGKINFFDWMKIFLEMPKLNPLFLKSVLSGSWLKTNNHLRQNREGFIKYSYII